MGEHGYRPKPPGVDSQPKRETQPGTVGVLFAFYETQKTRTTHSLETAVGPTKDRLEKTLKENVIAHEILSTICTNRKGVIHTNMEVGKALKLLEELDNMITEISNRTEGEYLHFNDKKYKKMDFFRAINSLNSRLVIELDNSIPQEVDKAKETKEKPQEWLDQKKERAFLDLRQTFRGVLEERDLVALQEWLIKFLDINLEGKIKLEDVSSLRYVEFNSESASQIAGVPVIRPVFLFADASQFQKFSVALRGQDAMATRGFNINPESLKGLDMFEETGLIICTSNPEFIGHEIRHTIDPHSGKRQGYNALLGEAFAYYTQFIKDETLKQYENRTSPQASPWQVLIGRLSSSVYWNTFSSSTEEKMSREEYGKLVQKVVEKIKTIQEKRGHIDTQRTIVQLQTIDELLQLIA